MAHIFKLDAVRLDIFTSLEKVFGADAVYWEGVFLPVMARSDRFAVVLTAGQDVKFNIKPLAEKLTPGYISGVGDPEGACYIRVATEGEEKSRTKILFDFKVSAWAAAKESVVKAMPEVVRKISISEVGVEESKVDRNKRLVKKLKEIFGPISRDESFNISAQMDNNNDIIILNNFYNKSFTYLEFISSIWMFAHLFGHDEKRYTVPANGVIDGVSWDNHYVKIKLSDFYIAGSDFEVIAERVVKDMVALAKEIDLTYCRTLRDFVADDYGVEAVSLGKDFLKKVMHASPEFESNNTEGYGPFVKTRLGYIENEGCFDLIRHNKSSEFRPDVNDLHQVISAAKDYVLAHGFVMCVGQANDIRLIPIKGDFDYAKNIPQICQLITNELQLYSDIFLFLQPQFEENAQLLFSKLLVSPVDSINGREAGSYEVIIRAPYTKNFGDDHFWVEDIAESDAARIETMECPNYPDQPDLAEIIELKFRVSTLSWELHKDKIVTWTLDFLENKLAESKTNLPRMEVEVELERKRQISNALQNIDNPLGPAGSILTSYIIASGELLANIQCIQPPAYTDLKPSLAMFRSVFEAAGDNYDVLHVIDRKETDNFYVTLRLRDSYLAGSDVGQISRRINDDVMRLAAKVNLTYYNELAANIAAPYQKKAASFDDGLGKSMAEKNGGVFKYPDFIRDDVNDARRSAATVFEFQAEYLDFIQAFCLWPSKWENNRLIGYDRDSEWLKEHQEYAISLGFVVFQGGENEFYVKPLAGDYNHEKNFPLLCQSLTESKAQMTQAAISDEIDEYYVRALAINNQLESMSRRRHYPSMIACYEPQYEDLRQDGKVELLLHYFQSFTYRRQPVDESRIRELFSKIGNGYRLTEIEIAEDGEYFILHVSCTSALLNRGNVSDVADRIHKDILNLLMLVDLDYFESLNNWIASKSGFKIQPFDDDLGGRLIGSEPRREFRLNRLESLKFARDTGLSTDEPFGILVRYLPQYQMFGVETIEIEYICSEKPGLVDDFIKRSAKSALELGFILYAGNIISTDHYFFIKPIGGDFDYERTFPKVCELLVNGISECFDRAEYGAKVAEDRLRESRDRARAGQNARG